jgi:hypothetical protein
VVKRQIRMLSALIATRRATRSKTVGQKGEERKDKVQGPKTTG